MSERVALLNIWCDALLWAAALALASPEHAYTLVVSTSREQRYECRVRLLQGLQGRGRLQHV